MPVSLILLAAAAPLTPSGPWTVHADIPACSLSRSYDTPNGPVNLVFQPALTDGAMAVTVLSPANGWDQTTGEGKVTRQPGGDPAKSRYYSTNLPKTKLRFTQLWIGPETFTKLPEASAIRFQAGRST